MTYIKDYRIKHNLSQRKLAEWLCVNIRTLQRWETGELNPRPIVFKLLENLSVKDQL